MSRLSPRLRLTVITLFPRMFEGPFSESILKRAQDKGLVQIHLSNLRDFAKDRHRTVDDRPYGGGSGMVLKSEPLYRAIRSARRRAGSRVFLLSAQGIPFTQAMAWELSRSKEFVLVCGRYEGVDERIMDFIDQEISIGDYVLTGGEIAAMAVVDAVVRLVPGVLSKAEAALRESFTDSLLDYPQYTRPHTWRRRNVPEVLLSGDHAAIESWRRQKALSATRRKRPELL